MLCFPYFRVVVVNLEVISWERNIRENLGFLSVMTLNDSVYFVPIRSSPGWLKIFSPTVRVADMLRSLIAAKSLRCLTGICTVLSNSELPNLMETGVV